MLVEVTGILGKFQTVGKDSMVANAKLFSFLTKTPFKLSEIFREGQSLLLTNLKEINYPSDIHPVLILKSKNESTFSTGTFSHLC